MTEDQLSRRLAGIKKGEVVVYYTGEVGGYSSAYWNARARFALAREACEKGVVTLVQKRICHEAEGRGIFSYMAVGI